MILYWDKYLTDILCHKFWPWRWKMEASNRHLVWWNIKQKNKSFSLYCFDFVNILVNTQECDTKSLQSFDSYFMLQLPLWMQCYVFMLWQPLTHISGLVDWMFNMIFTHQGSAVKVCVCATFFPLISLIQRPLDRVCSFLPEQSKTNKTYKIKNWESCPQALTSEEPHSTQKSQLDACLLPLHFFLCLLNVRALMGTPVVLFLSSLPYKI